MQCRTCHGMRFVLVERPQMVSKVFYREPDGSVCWPCDVGTPVRETFHTGRTVEINEPCTSCQGSGLALDPAQNPACPQCHGTGERNALDPSLEWETEDCTCSAPVRMNIVEMVYVDGGEVS